MFTEKILNFLNTKRLRQSVKCQRQEQCNLHSLWRLPGKLSDFFACGPADCHCIICQFEPLRLVGSRIERRGRPRDARASQKLREREQASRSLITMRDFSRLRVVTARQAGPVNMTGNPNAVSLNRLYLLFTSKAPFRNRQRSFAKFATCV
jgi:hypothetical protein